MPEYGLKIAEDFKTFLKTGDAQLIDHYSAKELKNAISLLSPYYNQNTQWFREIERRVFTLTNIQESKRARFYRWLKSSTTKWLDKAVAFTLGLTLGVLL